jgi:hypothetical protein
MTGVSARKRNKPQLLDTESDLALLSGVMRINLMIRGIELNERA